MKLQFMGAASEVGRSCIIVNDRYLLDAGIMLKKPNVHYPETFDVKAIKAVFLSHAHLDHSGALPSFVSKGMKCSIFTTKMTQALTKILLYDSFKVASLHQDSVPYTEEDVSDTLDMISPVSFGKKGTFENINYTYYSSGHIPGSSSILLEINDQKVFYTGDICLHDSRLLVKASCVPNDVDVLITEGTYGDRNHSPRSEEAERFISAVKETIAKGGSVIIPVFAVGRAHEIIMLLAEHDFEVPIYLDGMARQVASIFLKGSDSLKDADAFRKACKKVKFVKSLNQRRKIAKEKGIFVTPSGMCDGGAVLEYLKTLHAGKNNALLFTGYLDSGSKGYALFNDTSVEIDDQKLQWKGHKAKFNFSGHSDQQEIIAYVKAIQPKHVVIQHGDSEVCKILQKELASVCDAKLHIPTTGEVLTL